MIASVERPDSRGGPLLLELGRRTTVTIGNSRFQRHVAVRTDAEHCALQDAMSQQEGDLNTGHQEQQRPCHF